MSYSQLSEQIIHQQKSGERDDDAIVLPYDHSTNKHLHTWYTSIHVFCWALTTNKLRTFQYIPILQLHANTKYKKPTDTYYKKTPNKNVSFPPSFNSQQNNNNNMALLTSDC